MDDQTVRRMIQDAADALGEALLEAAENPDTQGYEEPAKVALLAGFSALADSDPAGSRLESVAQAVYLKLHDVDQRPWSELDEAQRALWLDIAGAAVQAADEGALAALREA